MAPDESKPQPHAEPEPPKPLAEIVRIDERMLPPEQPDRLSGADAIRIVKMIAAQTGNIFLIPYARKRATQRRINRRQIELCVQRGILTEGPFLNLHGNWQMNLSRNAAGEELTCVVAIEWASRLLVINAF